MPRERRLPPRTLRRHLDTIRLVHDALCAGVHEAPLPASWRYHCDRCARRVPDLHRCQVCRLDVCRLCLGLRPGASAARPTCKVHHATLTR